MSVAWIQLVTLLTAGMPSFSAIWMSVVSKNSFPFLHWQPIHICNLSFIDFSSTLNFKFHCMNVKSMRLPNHWNIKLLEFKSKASGDECGYLYIVGGFDFLCFKISAFAYFQSNNDFYSTDKFAVGLASKLYVWSHCMCLKRAHYKIETELELQHVLPF